VLAKRNGAASQWRRPPRILFAAANNASAMMLCAIGLCVADHDGHASDRHGWDAWAVVNDMLVDETCRQCGEREREEPMTALTLNKWWKRSCLRFIKCCLATPKRSSWITQGFPMRRLHRHNGFWFAEVSVFDFQRTKGAKSQRADQQPAR